MSETFHSPFWYRLSGLRPRLKPHVEVSLHDYLGAPWYVLRDPVTGKVHRFSEAAYAVIGGMDGRHTLDEIWEDAARRLDTDAPSQTDIVQLMSQLYQADLLSVDGVPDATEVLERMKRNRAGKRQRFYKNPLSIPLPLFNPDAALSAMAPLVTGRAAGLFWVAAWLVVVMPALVLLPAHFGAVMAGGPREWLAMENLLLMAIVYPVMKFFHELAHGLVLKRYGGESHEVGIMFLVFYPVPYIDASASAFFANKGQRALVGAAGILAEIWLSAAAFLVWLVAEPGLVRDLMFNTMLIGGVSTLVVNGNPLLKFDGYHVMCDLCETPNMGTRSNNYWGYLVKTHILRLADEKGRPSTRFERVLFSIYAPAAFVYRLFVMLGIATLVATQYLIVGVVLACWSIFQGFVMPTLKMLSKLWSDARLAERRGRAWAIIGACGAAALIALFMVPAPFWVTSQGVVWLPENAHIRAGSSGTIVTLPLPNGRAARPGDRVLVMDNVETGTQLQVQDARYSEAALIASAEQVRDQAAYLLARERAMQEAARRDNLAGRVADLTVAAGIGGKVFFPHSERLQGRFVGEGELVGYLLPEGPGIVRVALFQADAEFLDTRLDAISAMAVETPGESHPGTLLRRVPSATGQLPSPALGSRGGGPFAIDPTDPDGRTTLDRLVQVDIAVPGLSAERFGGRVLVKFGLGWEPVGFRLYRAVRIAFLNLFSGV